MFHNGIGSLGSFRERNKYDAKDYGEEYQSIKSLHVIVLYPHSFTGITYELRVIH